MKQKLIFTLIAATLAGTAQAAPDEKEGSGNVSNMESTTQKEVALNEALVREHFIRVAELAGFEVLGTSNPDTVDVSVMVLTVRPQAERVMWLSNHYNKESSRGNGAENGGDRRHDEDDD